MKKYEEMKFNIGELKGISTKNIEEHLKLYSGYVKNTNMITEKIAELTQSDPEKNTYIVGELHRRYGFEFNGMRNHEYYFKSLEGGSKPLPENSKFMEVLQKDTPFETWLNDFKSLAMTRGIGWAVVYYDKQANQLVHTWIDEQQIGQLNGLNWILGIDMWEHAFIYDYSTSEKKKYVDAFFDNINWEVIEQNFLVAQ